MKKQSKSTYIKELVSEADDILSGRTAAARVVEVILDDDGKLVSRRDLDPEKERTEAARNFAIRSEVARVRRRLDLSQAAFAKRLGIPLSTVQKWERNTTQPSGAAATLLRILDRRPEVLEVLD